MIEQKSYTLKGSNEKLISADLTYASYKDEVPICIFLHGFKGFKDWGAWPLAAQIFAHKGIPFLKFNFSHNGTSPAKPTEFVDLDAFANNDLSKQLAELGLVMDFVENKAEQFPFNWDGRFFVIGHSLGGSIALLKTASDPRINKCASWAAVADLDRYLNMADPKVWEQKGHIVIPNSRTGQDMPLNYNFYLDLLTHRGKFNVLERVEELQQDLLIVHGDKDNVVSSSEAEQIYLAVQHSIKLIIEGADHVFNTHHPLREKKIPLAFAQLVDETIEFFLM